MRTLQDIIQAIQVIHNDNEHKNLKFRNKNQNF